MKRVRNKLVGFGLAVLAGSAIAGDDIQQVDPGAPPAQSGSEPRPLPSLVRFSPVVPDTVDPPWFPGSKPAQSGTTPPTFAPVQSGSIPIMPASGMVVNSASAPPAVVPTSGAVVEQTPGLHPGGMERLAPRPLAVRILLPWLQKDVTPENWPPPGPRVGLVPQDPVPVSAEYLPPPGIFAVPPQAPQQLPQMMTQSQAPTTIAAPIALQTGPVPNSTIPVAPTMLPGPLELPPPNMAIAEIGPGPLELPPPNMAIAEIGRGPLELPPPNMAIAQVPAVPAGVVPQQSPSTPTAVPGQVQAVAPMQPQNVQVVPLPQPRPLEPSPVAPTPPGPAATVPQQPELPTAPPELLVPSGTVVPHAHAFGSSPISLGCDYPSLLDLCGTPLRDRLAAGLLEDRPNVDRGYVEAEYLMWWMTGMKVPPLATTSTSPAGNGFLGEPGTVPLLGPGPFLGSFREGIRVRAGFWLDDCKSWSIDGSFFLLGERDADAAYGFNQYSVITRPVFSPNPIPGGSTIIGETGEAVAVPGVLDGVLKAHAQSILFGGDLNLNRCLFSDCNSHATVFVGYRNLDLIESLTIDENIQVVGSGGSKIIVNDPIGTMVSVQDRFATQNYFNGGQIGGTYNRQWGRFDLDARASVALGATQQDLQISGYQTLTPPGQPTQTFRGGLLAVGPNLGDFTQTHFSVVPEVTFNLGYWVTPNVKIYAGYNFLYWSDVIRPGQQIDRVVNLAYVPNGPTVGTSSLVRPEALFQQSNLIVHGIQFGLEYHW